MNDRIESIYKGLVLGDTLGSLFEGMSRGHVESHFKQLSGYPDTADALVKGHHDRWRKPGLYSALTQFAVISSLAGCDRPLSFQSLRTFIAAKGRVLDADGGVFRNPPRAIQNFLFSCFKNSSIEEIAAPADHSAFMVMAASGVLPMFIYSSPPPDEIMEYISHFAASTHSAVGSSLFVSILYRGIHDETGDIMTVANEESESLVEFCRTNQPQLFAKGFNPDRVIESALLYKEIFSKIASVRDSVKAESEIVKLYNRIVKTPVTRATVDHPCAILPFACVLAAGHLPDMIYSAAKLGGASEELASASGMISGAFFGDNFPEELLTGLVNRRALFEKIALAVSGDGTISDAEEFFENEIPLTTKVMAERGSQFKHAKTPEKKKETPRSREEALSRHVVESWTKLDRARWKKEKKHESSDEEFSD